MIIELTNHPDTTDIKRKAELLRQIWEPETGMIVIHLMITYYEDNAGEYGDMITSELFKPHMVKGVASSDEYVDTNGDEVAEGTEGALTEYDYFCTFTPTDMGISTDSDILTLQQAVTTAAIQSMDSKAKFN